MINAGFRQPLILTAVTQLSTAVVAVFLVGVAGVVPFQHSMTWAYAQTVLVVGFASAITLCLGNSAYL